MSGELLKVAAVKISLTIWYRANAQLEECKATNAAEIENSSLEDGFAGGQAAPQLLHFFELIHLSDLIDQMIHVYYKQEVCLFVDDTKFFLPINKAKKAFSESLDDFVASGMDRCIEVKI